MGDSGFLTAFGQPMRKHFMFDKQWKNLNHGSFGTYPTEVRQVLRGFQDACESGPDKFMRFDCAALLENARQTVAENIKAPVDECVFVMNATTGVNVVLRNIKWQEKDVLIYFDTVYEACKMTLLSVQEMNPQLQLRKVEYTAPASHADICTAFSQTVSRVLYEGYTPRLAMFDTITSVPGFRFPFERLVKICKEYNILSLIDGAHAVGQIPLNLSQLDPDFFVSNCHKWLYTPRGCAVFFVPKRNQDLIRTALPTSWGFTPPDQLVAGAKLPMHTKSKFVNNFQYVATADMCPYYCVPAAIKFRQDVCGGDEVIYKYLRDLAQQGADVLAKILGTRVMDDREPDAVERGEWAGSMRDCAMANVLLPIRVEGSDGQDYPPGSITLPKAELSEHASWLVKTLIHDHHTHVQIFQYDDKLWARVSGQIYLELQDFEWVGGIFKELLGRIRKGELQNA